MIAFAVWLAALVVGLERFRGDLPHWVKLAMHAFGPTVLILVVARSSPRRFVDAVLVICFAVWVVGFFLALAPFRNDIPSWALPVWYYFGPAALLVLVVRAWGTQAHVGPVLEHPGERPLLVGFAVASVAVGMLGLVMFGTIELLFLGPVAIGSMAAGVYQAREKGAPLYRQAMALVLIIAGLWALLWMSQETVRVAHQWAVASLPTAVRRGAQAPPLGAWLQIAAGWLVPAFLWGVGLRLWAGWSAGRCLAWVAMVLIIPIVALQIYRLVLLTNPPLAA